MASLETNDTEITLGMGKLLALFFALVILCGISLGVGYSLGRNSAKQAAAAAAAAPAAPASPAVPANNKPGASQAPSPKPDGCAAGDNCTPQSASAPGSASDNLTFYQSVQQKDAHPQLAPPEPAPAAPARSVEVRSTLGTGYLVQIAAVRNQDDAKLLSSTLQKKQYPVIIAQPGDKLFHVQVGPYADIKEAEAIRTRLVNEGYNAFLKR